jgi:Fe-S cluster assembly protein SufD
MNIEQPYIDIYKKYAGTIKENSTGILNRERDAAFASFLEKGFPTCKMEEFKYTDLRKYFAPDYGMNIKQLPIPFNPYEVFKCNVRGINSYLYYVVNDIFYQVDNQIEDLKEKGVLIGSLREFSQAYPSLVSQYYGKAAGIEESTVAFNTSFAQDGFFLYVPENVKIEKPIQLINVVRADMPLMATSRNLIILERGAHAKVLVCAHALDPHAFLCNRVTEVFAGENSTYEQYKLESTHSRMTNIGSLFVEQAAHSDVLVNEITLLNGVTRNNIRVNLNGRHANTLLCGIAVGDKKQHIDNHTIINHISPDCVSRELYKYVLDGEAVGGFSGKILVGRDAQKTQAFQNNKNICLSPGARMYSKPQLEIYADDVKCSHGATTGQMDEAILFYMRTRGIPEKEARMLLMLAFANDVIENIRVDALKSRIRTLVENRFRGDLTQCSGCEMCNG